MRIMKRHSARFWRHFWRRWWIQQYLRHVVQGPLEAAQCPPSTSTLSYQLSLPKSVFAEYDLQAAARHIFSTIFGVGEKAPNSTRSGPATLIHFLDTGSPCRNHSGAFKASGFILEARKRKDGNKTFSVQLQRHSKPDKAFKKACMALCPALAKQYDWKCKLKTDVQHHVHGGITSKYSTLSGSSGAEWYNSMMGGTETAGRLQKAFPVLQLSPWMDQKAVKVYRSAKQTSVAVNVSVPYSPTGVKIEMVLWKLDDDSILGGEVHWSSVCREGVEACKSLQTKASQYFHKVAAQAKALKVQSTTTLTEKLFAHGAPSFCAAKAAKAKGANLQHKHELHEKAKAKATLKKTAKASAASLSKVKHEIHGKAKATAALKKTAKAKVKHEIHEKAKAKAASAMAANAEAAKMKMLKHEIHEKAEALASKNAKAQAKKTAHAKSNKQTVHVSEADMKNSVDAAKAARALDESIKKAAERALRKSSAARRRKVLKKKAATKAIKQAKKKVQKTGNKVKAKLAEAKQMARAAAAASATAKQAKEDAKGTVGAKKAMMKKIAKALALKASMKKALAKQAAKDAKVP